MKSAEPETEAVANESMVDKLKRRRIVDSADSLCIGSLVERTKCMACEHVTENSVNFSDICLPVEKARKRRCLPQDSLESEDEECNGNAGTGLNRFFSVEPCRYQTCF